MSNYTGTWTELLYKNTADFTARNTFTVEATGNLLNTTAGPQAKIPAGFWPADPAEGVGKGFGIRAHGLMSTFTSGTHILGVRLGGAASITGPAILSTPTMTMTASQTNVPFLFTAQVFLVTAGANGANSTLRANGLFQSPALASPFMQIMLPTATLGTLTLTTDTIATVDISIDNYINVTPVWSVSSASNSTTLTMLEIFGLN
jgi:hypothetical protein